MSVVVLNILIILFSKRGSDQFRVILFLKCVQSIVRRGLHVSLQVEDLE